MDTVDHDELAAEAAGEGTQEQPLEIAEMDARQLRQAFVGALNEHASEVESAIAEVRQGATLGALSTLAMLSRVMREQARELQP